MFYSVCSIHQPLWTVSQSVNAHHYSIHSRFSHAINFVDKEGLMMTFLSQGLPNAPNTAVINCESFDGLEMADNAQLILSGAEFLLGNIVFQLSVETKIWSSRLPILSASHRTSTQTAIEQFLLENCEALSAIEKIIYEKLDGLYDKAFEAYRHQDSPLFINTITETIGLGLGLTPSGDDRLVGFLLGCYTYQKEQSLLLGNIQKVIDHAKDRTNDISFAMLKEAREGRFNEWLIDLVHASNNGDQHRLAIAMDKVFSIGSRSGGDMLKGFSLFCGLPNSHVP